MWSNHLARTEHFNSIHQHNHQIAFTCTTQTEIFLTKKFFHKFQKVLKNVI